MTHIPFESVRIPNGQKDGEGPCRCSDSQLRLRRQRGVEAYELGDAELHQEYWRQWLAGD